MKGVAPRALGAAGANGGAVGVKAATVGLNGAAAVLVPRWVAADGPIGAAVLRWTAGGVELGGVLDATGRRAGDCGDGCVGDTAVEGAECVGGAVGMGAPRRGVASAGVR
ncbi:hypothetical protein ACQEWB_35290 [Streptomyces sp. CA-249302]|uniref:hypothetical protein n=1 Tax=Streptomyces sp. CA-249302 TaxID=3240058 RepID=UPI003D925D92